MRSARNQLRSPGDTVGILTPRLPDSQPSPSSRHPSTTRPGGLHRPLGRQAFPTQSSVSKQHHIPSVGPLETQPSGSLTATPRLRLLHQVLTCRCSTAVSTSAGSAWGPAFRAAPVDGEQVGLRGLLPFDIDCPESVFSIRPAFGTLVGKARMTLCCVFSPPTHHLLTAGGLSHPPPGELAGKGEARLPRSWRPNPRPGHENRARCSITCILELARIFSSRAPNLAFGARGWLGACRGSLPARWVGQSCSHCCQPGTLALTPRSTCRAESLGVTTPPGP